MAADLTQNDHYFLEAEVLSIFDLVIPLKDKKAKTAFHGFIEIVNESNRKPNKLLVDQGREFYNNFIQKWLDGNDILIYYTHNGGKSVVADRLINIFNGKIYKKLRLIIVNLTLVI